MKKIRQRYTRFNVRNLNALQIHWKLGWHREYSARRPLSLDTYYYTGARALCKILGEKKLLEILTMLGFQTIWGATVRSDSEFTNPIEDMQTDYEIVATDLMSYPRYKLGVNREGKRSLFY